MLNISAQIPRRVLNMGKNTNRGVLRGLAKAALIVQKEAAGTKSFIDRSGVLRGSIRAERVDKANKTVDVTVKAISVITGKPYAKYIEFGTKHIKARNFMKDAADNNQNNITKTIKDEIVRSMRNDT